MNCSLSTFSHLFSLDYSKRVLNSVSCSSSDYLTILQCSYKISSDDKCHQPSQLGIIINCCKLAELDLSDDNRMMSLFTNTGETRKVAYNLSIY